jgi:two-component system, response regulator YesN
VVGSARSGKEAYELALQHKPDVIVTDIKMPGMDGIELMQAILEHLPYTNFIILTNHAEFAYARAAMAYGAKHYLLKSELRSADLIALLLELNAAKINLLNGKRTDIYANGFLDIYDLYQHPGEPDFARNFCLRHGMEQNLPYCIMGMHESNLFGQKELLDSIMQEVQPIYAIAALQQQMVFVLLQETKANVLEDKARRIAERYTKDGKKQVGIGHVKHDLMELLSALNETESLVHAMFFHYSEPILTFNQFFHRQPVNRSLVRSLNQEVIIALENRDAGKTLAALQSWSSAFEKIALQDVLWAKETWLKMVFSLEERVSIMHSDATDCLTGESGGITNAKACWDCMTAMVHALEKNWSQGYTRAIVEALAYIRTNYAKQISLMELANHVGLSPEYFSRLFKEETGENFSVHLMMYRLNQAQKLLKQTDLKVYEIATMVGYATPSYFSKLYRTYMGVLPEAQRKTHNDETVKS